MLLRWLTCICLTLVCYGCAQPFPKPDIVDGSKSKPAHELLESAFAAHGGESLDELNEYRVSLTGEWDTLITKIQPLVTDYTYRVDSEEQYFLPQKRYIAQYQGPAGTKRVERTTDDIQVAYNGETTTDKDALHSSALTADAYFIFSLPTLTVKDQLSELSLLPAGEIDGRRYERVYGVLTPGIGYSDRDEIVFWIDPETYLVRRVHITLEGYKTTQGAHVDVTFLKYQSVGAFTLPTEFVEHVRGPITIRAHRWQYSNIEIR